MRWMEVPTFNLQRSVLEMVCFFFFFFKQKTAYEMQRGLVGSEMCIRDSVDSKRKIMYKENSNCISVGLEFDDVPIVEIMLHNDLNKQKIIQKTAQGTYKGFVIDNIYKEECWEREFSSKQIYIALAIACVVTIITGALIYCSFQYRSKYYLSLIHI
eukprot:TRINITY_DN28784_c0_g1_i1.p1 TRINITY_DN28784_c0_g1~~TRINITY_DN28784_c0_g1_i1.p1  ORF type:complete len:157 (-),score=43.26 TRINITY_DN28784_c0_g1_i1:142-612(-)